MKEINLKINTDSIGMRFDKFIAENSEFSRNRIQNLIDEDLIFFNEYPLEKASQKIKIVGDLQIYIPPPQEWNIKAIEMPLEVIYEDKSLVVLIKPAGLIVHPGSGKNVPTLVHGLLAHCGDSLTGVGDVKRPGLVHRLDKDTHGLMVVAKTQYCLEKLQKQFHDRLVKKKYQAIGIGSLPKIPSEGNLITGFGRDQKQRKKFKSYEKGQGKKAETFYKIIKSNGIVHQIELFPKTGRSHQLRVHSKIELNCPLLFDPIYSDPSKNLKNILNLGFQIKKDYSPILCLAAVELNFVHPITKEPKHFRCSIPDHMKVIWDQI